MDGLIKGVAASRFLRMPSRGGFVALVFAGVAFWQGAGGQTVSHQDKVSDPFSLAALAQQAKKEGKRQATKTYGFVNIPMRLHGARDAMSRFSVAEVRLEDQYSVPDDDGRDVVTWCKFHVVSQLSPWRSALMPPKPVSTMRNETRPTKFLPVPAATVVVQRAGGRLTIDGVEIIERDLTFPEFQRGATYLLFLEWSDGIAYVAMEAAGVYLIKDSDTLVPAVRTSSEIQQEMEALSGGSLLRLRQVMRSGGYDR